MLAKIATAHIRQSFLPGFVNIRTKSGSENVNKNAVKGGLARRMAGPEKDVITILKTKITESNTHEMISQGQRRAMKDIKNISHRNGVAARFMTTDIGLKRFWLNSDI